MVLYVVGAVVAAGLFAFAVAPRNQGHNRPHVTDLAANDAAAVKAEKAAAHAVKTVA